MWQPLPMAVRAWTNNPCNALPAVPEGESYVASSVPMWYAMKAIIYIAGGVASSLLDHEPGNRELPFPICAGKERNQQEVLIRSRYFRALSQSVRRFCAW